MAFDTRLRKAWMLWSVAAALCALARISPAIFSIIPLNIAACAGRGLAAAQGIPGIDASLVDRVAAFLWKTGGEPWLWAAHWIVAWAGWTILLSLLCLAALAVRRWAGSRSLRFGALALMILTLLAAAGTGIHNTLRLSSEQVSKNPGLSYPLALMEMARSRDGQPAFSNPAALTYQLLWAPKTVDAEISLRSSLGLDPGKWRQAARERQWQTVILAGPPAEYQALLDHLAASPDWRLAYVDNQGFLFVKGSGADVPAPVLEEIREPSEIEQAVYLAQLAERFDSLQWNGPSRSFLAQAFELAPQHPDVLSHAASIAARNKRWRDALKYSDMILKDRPADVHARLVRVLALDETGRGGEALDALDELRASLPEDPYILFLHARLCRKANDYARESSSLQQLIRLTELRGESAADYRIYLGQSLAKQGFARQALEQFQAVLDSGRLNAEQAKMVRDAMEAIQARRAKESS